MRIDATPDENRAAFERDLEGHPDSGGSSERFQRLKRPRETMIGN